MFVDGSGTRHVLWTRAPAVIVQLVVVSAAGDSVGPVRRTARAAPPFDEAAAGGGSDDDDDDGRTVVASPPPERVERALACIII